MYKKDQLRHGDSEKVQSGIGQLGMMQENGSIQSLIGQLTVDYQGFPFKLSWTHYQVLMTIEDPAADIPAPGAVWRR